jgi:hypothetical protein
MLHQGKTSTKKEKDVESVAKELKSASKYLDKVKDLVQEHTEAGASVRTMNAAQIRLAQVSVLFP